MIVQNNTSGNNFSNSGSQNQTGFIANLVVFWQVIRNIAFLPLILGLSAYLFLGVGQLHDVVVGLKPEFNQEYQMLLGESMIFQGFAFIYPVALLLWSFTAYSCSRIVLLSPIYIYKISKIYPMGDGYITFLDNGISLL